MVALIRHSIDKKQAHLVRLSEFVKSGQDLIDVRLEFLEHIL
jgi:hypothetical protein